MSVELVQQPARRIPEPRGTKPTGKVRAAIEAMVWDGLPRGKAAAKAAISEHGLYKALRKPPVKAYYLSELEELRNSERARNIHRLCEIRDAANNMPAVNAIKTLMQIDETGDAPRAQHAPGFVVIVQSGAAVQVNSGHDVGKVGGTAPSEPET